MEGALAPTITEPEVTNSVTFMSYNSTGISLVKTKWINELCIDENVDFLSIHEHFKLTKNTDKFFLDNFRDHHSYVIPAHRSPGQDTGRGKGGLAQLSRVCHAVKRDRVVTRC